jgi:hypothetical protein
MIRSVRLAVAVAILASGCAPDVEGTPVPAPQKIDCNLIFPPPLVES